MMNKDLMIIFLAFLSVFFLIIAIDLLRGRKSVFGKYIDRSTSIYDFAESLSPFVPNLADDIKREELSNKIRWSGDVLGVSVEGYYALRLILGLLGFGLVFLLYPLGVSPLLGVIAGILFSLIP